MHVDPRDFLATFKDTLDEMYDTAKKKNNDYTGGKGAFANFELGSQFGIGETDAGILWRMSDKFARIVALRGSEGQVDESVKDTLLDLANYAIILSIWYETQGAGDASGRRDETKDIRLLATRDQVA